MNFHEKQDFYFIFTSLVCFVKFFTVAFWLFIFTFGMAQVRKKLWKEKKPNILGWNKNKEIVKRETNISPSPSPAVAI